MTDFCIKPQPIIERRHAIDHHISNFERLKEAGRSATIPWESTFSDDLQPETWGTFFKLTPIDHQ